MRGGHERPAQHTHTKATQSELEAAREKLALLEIFLSGDEELIESMTEAARARRPGGHQAADEAKEPAPAPAPPAAASQAKVPYANCRLFM